MSQIGAGNYIYERIRDWPKMPNGNIYSGLTVDQSVDKFVRVK